MGHAPARSTLSPLWLLLLIGCAPRNAPVQAATPSLIELSPHMPAAARDAYTRALSQPRDPLLLAATREVNWVLSLSGAAGKIALDHANGQPLPSRPVLRERVWRAGYAYAVLQTKVWVVPAQSPFPEAISAWLSEHPAHDFGLARARSHGKDVWIGLRAAPSVLLPPLPRSRALGQDITFPPLKDAQLHAVDPSGQLNTYALNDGAQTLRLNEAGEWFFEISSPQKTLAKFPVYVGTESPTLSVIESLDDPASAPFHDRLNALRTLYGLSPWAHDPLLDHGAQALSEGRDLSAVQGLAAHPTLWTCPYEPVDACLDHWLWTAQTRAFFLSHSTQLLGLYHSENTQTHKWWLLLSEIDGSD